MVSIGLIMPATITLKNIPDDIYASLRAAADSHHRSLNGEVIDCLQRALLPAKISADERLNRARVLRSGFKNQTFSSAEIAKVIKQGRMWLLWIPISSLRFTYPVI